MTNWNELELPESYFHDNNVYIIKGDCLKVMPQLPYSCVDLALTDPPYGVCASDKDDIVDLKSLRQLVRVLKPDRGLFCFAGQASIHRFMSCLETQMTWLNTIIWHYDNVIVREKYRFGISYDPILFYVKGKKFNYFNADAVRVEYKSKERLKNPVFKNGKAWYPNPNGALRKDIWDCPAITSPAYTKEKVNHKWQKPIEIFAPMILSASKKGDIVLDPFLGSGTTLIASSKLDRKCIGIEISEEYCELATIRYLRSLNE